MTFASVNIPCCCRRGETGNCCLPAFYTHGAHTPPITINRHQGTPPLVGHVIWNGKFGTVRAPSWWIRNSLKPASGIAVSHRLRSLTAYEKCPSLQQS